MPLTKEAIIYLAKHYTNYINRKLTEQLIKRNGGVIMNNITKILNFKESVLIEYEDFNDWVRDNVIQILNVCRSRFSDLKHEFEDKDEWVNHVDEEDDITWLSHKLLSPSACLGLYELVQLVKEDDNEVDTTLDAFKKVAYQVFCETHPEFKNKIILIYEYCA